MSGRPAATRSRTADPLVAGLPRAQPAGDEPARTTTEQLLAELSHDLRAPLTSVQLLVQALLDGVVNEGRRAEYLARMNEQILLLGALVDDLHALGRAQAGGRGSARQCMHPHELIDGAVETMRVQAEVRNVLLEKDLPSSLPLLCANPIELQRMLLNLIDNAVRHAGEGGRVIVRAERTACGVEIEVEDDGEGIAVEERERVFAAFHGADRLASTARSGLGLAIARAMVEAHGGRIWLAESKCGTRVRLSLPTLAQRRPRAGVAHTPWRDF